MIISLSIKVMILLLKTNLKMLIVLKGGRHPSTQLSDEKITLSFHYLYPILI